MPKKQRERRRRGDGTVSVAKRDKTGKPILWKASISLGVVTIDGKARRNRPTEYAESEPEAYQKLKRTSKPCAARAPMPRTSRNAVCILSPRSAA